MTVRSRPSLFIARALVALLAAAVLTLSAACDDDEDTTPDSTTPSPSASREIPTSSSGSPTALASPSGPTLAAPDVIAGNYEPVRAFPQAAFSRMVALVPIPGDADHAVVLTQQEGIVHRISLTDNAEAPTVFLDVSDRLIENPGNEEGLLGLAFSPEYQTDRRLYIAYSAGGPRRNTIARYTAPGDAADPSSASIILEVEDYASNHNGGALAFGPDGYLYIALGDGGGAGDPQKNGQNLNTRLGKILRIDVAGDTYAVPPDNPFVGSGAGEIWAYGLRNPWRFSFDRATGDLWLGDVGQGTWEEVDRIDRGGNYGWSVTEGPDCYNAGACNRDGLIAPRTAYRTHELGTCAVTGGYVYRGAALPELVGWYIYGDFCSGHVWAFDTPDAASEPVLLMDTDYSIASFAEDLAGEVYLVTFNDAIFRIERR